MSGTTTNTFSVGRDCQIVLIGPYGRVDLSHVTAFECRQVTHPVRINRIDGIQLATELPRGWDGSFELERGSSIVEDFIAQLESGFYAGAAFTTSTLYQYINELNGSTSTYQFQSAVFKLAHAGVWRGDTSVKQRLEFFATQRTRL